MLSILQESVFKGDKVAARIDFWASCNFHRIDLANSYGVRKIQFLPHGIPRTFPVLSTCCWVFSKTLQLLVYCYILQEVGHVLLLVS